MNFDEINFNREQVLQHISSFYHYGICFENHYKKIEIIENALNTTHEKLIKAIKERESHNHKRNMIWTFQRLIEYYNLVFIHDSDYYNNRLAKICLKKFKDNKDLIDRISEIIMHEEFTHRNHETLLRPYLFDFTHNCRIHPYDSYRRRRERLEEKLTSLILKWHQEDKEIESMLDERVTKIIGIKQEEVNKK